MRYSMTFQVELYDFERDEWHKLLVTPGDYIRMNTWADEHMPDRAGDTVTNLRLNYATAWFSLKRAHRLGEFGLPEQLSVDVLDSMADRMSVYVDEYQMEGDTPPLPQGPQTT